MRDKDYIQMLEKLRRELHRRYGKKVCPELDLSCIQCQVNVVIGAINNLADTARYAAKFREDIRKVRLSGFSARVCTNGHRMVGIGSDVCPECEAPWREKGK